MKSNCLKSYKYKNNLVLRQSIVEIDIVKLERSRREKILATGGISEVVLWCYSDGYQGQEGAHDRGAK